MTKTGGEKPNHDLTKKKSEEKKSSAAMTKTGGEKPNHDLTKKQSEEKKSSAAMTKTGGERPNHDLIREESEKKTSARKTKTCGENPNAEKSESRKSTEKPEENDDREVDEIVEESDSKIKGSLRVVLRRRPVPETYKNDSESEWGSPSQISFAEDSSVYSDEDTDREEESTTAVRVDEPPQKERSTPETTSENDEPLDLCIRNIRKTTKRDDGTHTAMTMQQLQLLEEAFQLIFRT